MNQANKFENALIEIIYFETNDILTSSGKVELPFDPFSLRNPDLNVLNALENSENE